MKKSNGDKIVRANAALETIIGQGARFEGSIDTDNDVLIDGEFKGKIKSAATIIINDGAKVSAEIEADFVVVHGTIDGVITVHKRIDIGSTGRITGEVRAASARVSEGGVIDGVCHIIPDAITKSTNKPAMPTQKPVMPTQKPTMPTQLPTEGKAKTDVA